MHHIIAGYRFYKLLTYSSHFQTKTLAIKFYLFWALQALYILFCYLFIKNKYF
jgi:hypothetical protein